MKNQRLRTPFEVGNVPLAEYPRPQFARESYFTLNGEWEYAIQNREMRFDGNYKGKILVPFSPEALLSGTEEGTVLKPDDALYYRREFTLPRGFLKAHTLLHFDAVDMLCTVTLNGIHVGEHLGGYLPFTIDVTGVIIPGKNVITLEVHDYTDTSYHTRAKQSLTPGGIWYSPQSGIWQSVWLESVPDAYIKDMAIEPDIDNDLLHLSFTKSKPLPVDVLVLDGDDIIEAQVCKGDEISIHLDNYELWSPENPKLYGLALRMGTDMVRSYFGMRKFSWVTDSRGKKRIGLNNKPYFMSGVLDQGYWSDGMLTPPSNAALEFDVKLVKSMGFNMIRKHIKIEPLRWYYHCDKEGVIVWQDMVSGGTKYNPLYIGVLAYLGVKVCDEGEHAYKRLARAERESRNEFENEVHATLDHLKNCVSIAMWVPFNEGWGQFDSKRISEEIARYDPTRLVDSVSGWNDQGKGSSEAKSMHIYFKPIRMPRREKRCLLLSEFGGYSLAVDEHVYNPDKSFGYRRMKNIAAFDEAFKKLYEKRIIPAISKGLSACVYTQLSDVEEEVNGLITYDRRVVKLSTDAAKSVNVKLKIRD